MESAGAQEQAEAAEDRGPRQFVATGLLLGAIGAVFAWELMVSSMTFGSADWDFSATLLMYLGGLSRRYIFEDREYWRLLMSPLLHGGFAHVALNSLALWIIGPRLEGIVGAGWMLAIFALSALTGDAFSLMINAPWIVSVGASGGIMGLFAAAVVMSYRLDPESGARTAMLSDAMRVLVPTLVPALFIPFGGGSQDGIDVAAHLGGAIGGFALGGLLYALNAPIPPATSA